MTLGHHRGVGLVDLVTGDVERLEDVGRGLDAEAVGERFGADARVAAVDLGRRDQGVLHLLGEGEELVVHGEHVVDQVAGDAVARDLHEAVGRGGGADGVDDGGAARGVARVPGGDVDDRDAARGGGGAHGLDGPTPGVAASTNRQPASPPVHTFGTFVPVRRQASA